MSVMMNVVMGVQIASICVQITLVAMSALALMDIPWILQQENAMVCTFITNIYNTYNCTFFKHSVYVYEILNASLRGNDIIWLGSLVVSKLDPFVVNFGITSGKSSGCKLWANLHHQL